jgi:hypothetical protein
MLMHRLSTIGSLAALLTFVAISPARADLPNPANSIVPPCFVGCPLGDIAFTVVVRDAANNPQPNSNVVLNFSTCAEVTFCVTQEPGTTVNGKIASRRTDALGVVTFHLHSGGLCPGSTVEVTADGVPLAFRSIVSTDQDGNLLVDATDVSIANGKVGGSDHSADFDCDGDVDSADLAALNTHQGHACDLPTPARPRSWGELKVIYR